MKYTNIVVFIGTTFMLTYAVKSQPPLPDLCGKCDQSSCESTEKCKYGVAKDDCNCCDVCVKLGGQHCGGKHSLDGVCQTGFVCNVRHPLSSKNIFLMDDHKYGKCEPDACQNVKCGLHQWCRLDIDSNPECYCHLSCSIEESPVCGMKNHIEYINSCTLKQAECTLQEHIGMVPGPCRDCFDMETGETMRNGDLNDTGNICEKRVCQNGRIKYILDEQCLLERGFDCTTRTRRHKKLSCREEGATCVIEEKSKDPKYPGLGNCRLPSPDFCYVKLPGGKVETYNKNDEFVHLTCIFIATCKGFNKLEYKPMCKSQAESDVQCNQNEIVQPVDIYLPDAPKCYCPEWRCFPKGETCSLPKSTGDCYAYMRRFYFDQKDGQCKKFVYGGCGGNLNNFRSQHECEISCARNGKGTTVIGNNDTNTLITGSIPAPPAKLLETPLEVAPLKLEIAEKPKLSEEDMKIYGKVKLSGKNIDLSESSCLVVTFRDITNPGALFVILESKQIDLSYHNTNNQIDYELVTKLPLMDSEHNRFTVNAVVYVGRCPSLSESTPRAGDYLSDNSQPVELLANVNDNKFEHDFTLYPFGMNQIDETMFPDGGETEKPNLSNRTMKVRGKITFPNSTGVLSSPSCLRMKLSDVTVADVSSILIKEVNIDVSNQNINKVFEYEFESKKPLDTWRSYSVSAVLNKGWCKAKDSLEWVRKGDYVTDTTFYVDIEDGKDDYEKDFFIICYQCKKGQESPRRQSDSRFEGNNDDDDFEGEDDLFSNDQVTLGKTTMTVKGKIILPSPIAKLPDNSCLHIKLSDVSLQDVAENVIYSKTITLESNTFNLGNLEYSFESQKPIDKDLYRTFTVSATLNKGWCPSFGSEDWVQIGDYLTDTAHDLQLEKEKSEYERDVNLILYTEDEDDDDEDDDDDNEDDFEERIKPQLGNNTMTIKGEIKFPKVVGTLPPSSCLRIAFADISIADYDAFIISKKIINLTDINIGNTYSYTLESKKPIGKSMTRRYTVAATLNIGWCPQKDTDKYVQKNDYLTDMDHYVSLTEEKNAYKMDVKVICFKCDDNKRADESIGEVGDIPSCIDGDEKYAEGQGKIIDCRYCECQHGKVVCFDRIKCPSLKCLPDQKVGTLKGECCPSCQDIKNSQCFDTVTLKRYVHGQFYKRDACTPCECNKGETICAKYDCPALDCQNPQIVEGECCPKCPEVKGCFEPFLNKTFKNGETFSRTVCVKCGCYDGHVYCATAGCARPSCPDGEIINIPELCCPVCSTETICKDEKMGTFVEGNYWQNEHCKFCECTENGVKCEEPNTNLDNCTDAVVLSPTCGRICLPPREKTEDYYP